MHLRVLDHSVCECQTCELRHNRDRTFVPTRPPQKGFGGLMIVGEGPGATEVRYKVPFVGPSGRVLDGMLEAAGLDRDSCIIANATGCMPPQTSRDKGFVESFPQAIPSCLPRLLTEIKIWRPRVILALGQAALTALTGLEEEHAKRVPRPTCELCGGGKKKCSLCRGLKTEVITYTTFKSDWKIGWVAGGIFNGKDLGLDEFGVKYVVPTYHPSFLLHKAKNHGGKEIGGQFIAAAVLQHFEKAKRLLTEDAQWSVSPKTTVEPEYIAAYTEEIGDKVAYAIDIETDSKDPEDVKTIKCVGIHKFYWDRVEYGSTIVIDTDGLRETGAPILQVLKEFLADPEAHKIFQNGIYDTDVIERIWGFKTEGYIGDTLVAHNAISPDEPHHLHHLAFTYTDASPWKPPRNKGGVESFENKDELHEYNARDTRATAYAMRSLRPLLSKEKVDRVHDVDMQMLTLARRMRQIGMPVDAERREIITVRAKETFATSLVEMQQFLEKEDFNPNSNAQLAWALYDPSGPCKLIPVGTTATGAPSADKSALAKYRNHPFVAKLLAYREAKHTLGTYIEGMEPKNGRLNFAWNPLGARTGRWTSSPNAQNWDKSHKWMCRPVEGRCIVGADFAQQQYRLLAAMSGDLDMIRLCLTADENRKLEPDYDPHSYVSQLAFGKGYTELNLKDPAHDKVVAVCKCETCARKSLRDLTKRVVYGMFFGGGAQTIRDSIIGSADYKGPPLSVDMVQGVLDAFFKAFTRVRPFQQECYEKATKAAEVRDPILGRRRVFPFGEVEYTVAVNFPIQAADASIMTLGLIDLLPRLPEVDPTAEIVAIVHDAVYVECLTDKAEKVGKLIEECLTCEMQLHLDAPHMLFSASAHAGEDWGSA